MLCPVELRRHVGITLTCTAIYCNIERKVEESNLQALIPGTVFKAALRPARYLPYAWHLPHAFRQAGLWHSL